MATTTFRYEREVVKIGGADYLATREKKEIILEDHNEVQPSQKDESGGAGPVVYVVLPIVVYVFDPPHGKPPAGRFNRKWKEAWKFASGPVKIFINGIARALLDWYLS